MFFVGFECSRKRAFSDLAAEQIAICNEKFRAVATELIGIKRFKNYHFAIARENCCQIFRSVKAAGFPKTLLVPIVRIFTTRSYRIKTTTYCTENLFSFLRC